MDECDLLLCLNIYLKDLEPFIQGKCKVFRVDRVSHQIRPRPQPHQSISRRASTRHRGHQVGRLVLRRNVGPQSDLRREQVDRSRDHTGRAQLGPAHLVQPDQPSRLADDAYQ